MHPNDHGVALIIVLLVTALLIALIFEFAYGTRVSLRAAVNYRDSQRAFYLARSGVNYVGRVLANNLSTNSTGSNNRFANIEQLNLDPLLIMPEISVKWEDESKKIKVTDVFDPSRKLMLEALFGIREIDLGVVGKMRDGASNIGKMRVLSELHQFMTEEQYQNVHEFLTMNQRVNKININTASTDVLLSLGLSPLVIGLINDKKPIDNLANVTELQTTFIPGTTLLAKNFLTVTTDDFKVTSCATVGGYTKCVEAVITRQASGTPPFIVNNWRSW